MTWWTPEAGMGAGHTVVPFEGRENGEFELEGLPEGTVYVLASTKELPRSPTVRVELGGGVEREVVLEVPEALVARGQVVDAASGDALGGAAVQLYTNNGGNYVSAWGGVAAVDAEGRFEVSGFAEGRNRYVIEAPGYATFLGDTWASAPGPVELGRVPLFRAQTLTVVLTGPLPEDLGGFSARCIASRFYDPVAFGADGIVTFEGMSPGRARVFVTMPDGTQTWHMVDLAPGEDWIVEVPYEDGPRLEVVVEPDGPGPLPEGLSVQATVLLGNGYSFRSGDVGEDGVAHLWGIAPGEVSVDVWNADGQRIAAALGRQEPRGATVRVPIAGRRQTFLVLDGHGQPVHDAELHLYLPGGQAGWSDYGYTDEQGLRTVRGFPAERVLAGLIHPDHGKVFGLPVDLASAPDPLVLSFEADAELRVRLVEQGSPRPGLQVRVLGGSGTYIVSWGTSDAEGLVRVLDLGPGTYELTVLHPGYWPAPAAVQATKGSEPSTFEVYRTGTLRLHARAVGGAAVTGLAVELEHAQLGRVADWIAAGRVAAPAGGLVTDGEGRLTLAGLPRGTYVWSAVVGDGIRLGGEGALFPGVGSELVITVP